MVVWLVVVDHRGCSAVMVAMFLAELPGFLWLLRDTVFFSRILRIVCRLFSGTTRSAVWGEYVGYLMVERVQEAIFYVW